MTREIDPVEADLLRRDSSEREGSRREIARVLPEPDVEKWPCRTGCGAMVGITQAGIDQHELGNRLLVSMGQRPATKLEVMWCPACRSQARKLEAEELARSLLPRQTEIPTDPLAAYKPTPRPQRKGKRPLPP